MSIIKHIAVTLIVMRGSMIFKIEVVSIGTGWLMQTPSDFNIVILIFFP